MSSSDKIDKNYVAIFEKLAKIVESPKDITVIDVFNKRARGEILDRYMQAGVITNPEGKFRIEMTETSRIDLFE